MTVKELIRMLQRQPFQNKEIGIDDGGHFITITEVIEHPVTATGHLPRDVSEYPDETRVGYVVVLI